MVQPPMPAPTITIDLIVALVEISLSICSLLGLSDSAIQESELWYGQVAKGSYAILSSLILEADQKSLDIGTNQTKIFS